MSTSLFRKDSWLVLLNRDKQDLSLMLPMMASKRKLWYVSEIGTVLLNSCYYIFLFLPLFRYNWNIPMHWTFDVFLLQEWSVKPWCAEKDTASECKKCRYYMQNSVIVSFIHVFRKVIKLSDGLLAEGTLNSSQHSGRQQSIPNSAQSFKKSINRHLYLHWFSLLWMPTH